MKQVFWMFLKTYFCAEFCANTLKNVVTRALKLPKSEFAHL